MIIFRDTIKRPVMDDTYFTLNSLKSTVLLYNKYLFKLNWTARSISMAERRLLVPESGSNSHALPCSSWVVTFLSINIKSYIERVHKS